MGGDGLVFDATEDQIAVGYTRSRQGGNTQAVTWILTKNETGEWIKGDEISAGHEARSIKFIDDKSYILVGDHSGHTKARIAKYTISDNQIKEQWQDTHGSGGSQQFRTITTKSNDNGDQIITAYGRSGQGSTYSATYDLNGKKLGSETTDINRADIGYGGTIIQLQRKPKVL